MIHTSSEKTLANTALLNFSFITGKSFKKIFGRGINEFNTRCSFHPLIKKIKNASHQEIGADPTYQYDK